MDFVQQQFIDPISNFPWSFLLIWLLLGAGFYLTFRTKFVQSGCLVDWCGSCVGPGKAAARASPPFRRSA